MKRKLSVLFLITMLCLTAGLLAACNNGAKIPDVSPTSWESYLDEVTDMLIAPLAPDGGKISLKIDGNMLAEGIPYDIFFALNYDLVSLENSLLITELNSEGNNIFSLKSNNAHSYVDIAPNTLLGDAKIKLTNIAIFDLLNLKFNEENYVQAAETLKLILTDIGKMLFDGVDVNKDKTLYSFTINKDIWSGASARYFNALLSQLDADTRALLFGILEVKSEADLIQSLPIISGKVNVNVSSGRITDFWSSELTVNGNPASFDFDIEIKNDLIDGLSDKFPTDDKGYNVNKIAASSIKGSASLFNRNDNRRAIKYGYDFNINIDAFKLIMNDYDLTALGDDNYLHLRLSHKCDGYCTEFCRDKLAWQKGGSKGAIIDIAFSPKDFGNYNVFIAINFKAIMSTEYFNTTNNYPIDLTAASLPEYYLITIPENDTYKIKVLTKFLTSIYFGTFNSDTDYALSMLDLAETFKNKPIFYDLFKQFLISEEYNTDIIKIKTDEHRYGQPNTYDIYKQTIYIIANDVPEIKEFYNDSMSSFIDGLRYGALDWSYEPRYADETGDALNNIYDKYGNLVHGVNTDKYVPMSATEAAGLKGCFLKMDYTGIYKDNLTDEFVKILSVKNIDYESREVQTVTVEVEYPNFLDYVYLQKLFETYEDVFSTEIKIRVKLTPERDRIFRQNLTLEEYSIVYNSPSIPEYMNASLNVIYAGGIKKTLSATGISDSVNASYDTINNIRYSVTDWGEIKVKFDVGNIVYSRQYYIKPPDSTTFEIRDDRLNSPIVGTPYFASLLIAYAQMFVYYGDTKVQLQLQLDDYYINNISLSNSSSYWKIQRGVTANVMLLTFFAPADYQVQIKKQGMVSEYFTLTVKTPQSVEPKYKFINDTATVNHYFTATAYTFNGNIQNLSHGETADTSKTFNVQAYLGKVQQGGTVAYAPIPLAAKDAEIKLQVNKSILESTALPPPINYDVPAMIIKKFNIVFSVKFTNPGYYKIVFSMLKGVTKLVNYEWFLFVDQNPTL